jgi:hypothetical protein
MERYRAQSPLETAKRNVKETEERIARITRRAIEMHALGYDTRQANRLLDNFYQLLELARHHLKLEEEIAVKNASVTKPSLPGK